MLDRVLARSQIALRLRLHQNVADPCGSGSTTMAIRLIQEEHAKLKKDSKNVVNSLNGEQIDKDWENFRGGKKEEERKRMEDEKEDEIF
jgi:hypothetical protein